MPAPAENDKRPPQLQPDSARVRVGDVGGVDVLSNDVSPAGLNLTVDPELVYLIINDSANVDCTIPHTNFFELGGFKSPS